MERLKSMKERLINCVESQLNDLDNVNAEELGEVVDMIKDLEETIYYCTVVEAMEDKEEHQETRYYPIMYYPGDAYSRGIREYRNVYPKEFRDYREGRSGEYRRSYMESKEMHEDKEKQMRELEHYMKELSGDIMEMIEDATPEERIILSQKMTTLADKIK